MCKVFKGYIKLILFFLVAILSFVVFLSFASAASCWSYTSSGTCGVDPSCIWKNDSWSSSGWCEEINCWSLYTQTQCANSTLQTLIGKTCTWQPGRTDYWCERLNCWSLSGTNQSACTNSTQGLSCSWNSNCYTKTWTPGVNCNGYSTQNQCLNATGCGWGQCQDQGCWSYSASDSCAKAKDPWNKLNCTWDSSGSGYCSSNGCWRYASNSTYCATGSAGAGLNCEWKYNYCQERGCWSFDFTNETTCVNNTLNQPCNWNSQWNTCSTKDCWSYSAQADCTSKPECNWKASVSSGWCQQLDCYTWDSWNGGNQSQCESNSYGLSCRWTGNPAGNATNGWCYRDISTTSCSNKTDESSCIGTYYCWWQYTNWSNVSQGGACRAPGEFNLAINTTIFDEWNPGCYIFDVNSTDCNKVLGCNYSNSQCVGLTDTYGSNISLTGINCSYVNDSNLCNSIPVLGSCCSWQNGTCTSDKFNNACKQVAAKTESSCEDAETNDRCLQIANSPWYMPCQWNNDTSKCLFKATDIFGNGTQSLTLIDNKFACQAAGGKWITENYCEGNVSVPTGRCEYKFDDEDNCDKACFACEKKDSSGNNVNSSNAETACKNSKLGSCEYRNDTNAPNGIGYCKAKEQFKKGIAGECDSNCGDCTFKGNPANNDTTKRPSYYCSLSKANAEEGGCKWANDNSTSQGGYCVKKSEKTCENACDRCETQSDCQNIGRTKIGESTLEKGGCLWEDGTKTCVANVGEDVEVCYDGIDNDNDNLIDCADASCYGDSFCGFTTGNCFGFITNTTCISNDCEWVTDNWGSWCDFKGSQCWKYNINETTCSVRTSCEWSNGTGTGWCEQNWDLSQNCMSLNRTACTGASASLNCTWTNDTWCDGVGKGSSWCTGDGGWCDYAPFKPKNCWQQSNSNSCNTQSGCNWYTDQWSQPHCEINWSRNCWNNNNNESCTNAGCNWRNETVSGYASAWCEQKTNICYNKNTESLCNNVIDTSGDALCSWKTNPWGSYCEPSCYNLNNATSCGVVDECVWKAESGWCQESASAGCWSLYNQTSCQGATGQALSCRWKNPGWCDPKGGFSSGSTSGGGTSGGGTAGGADCYKYDGNQSLCTNKTIINITCGWSSNPSPNCQVDWSQDCWAYTGNTSCINAGCYWKNDSYGAWCSNTMDQCWNINNQTGCTATGKCSWVNQTWGASCQPSCTNSTITGNQTLCRATTGCKWNSGWCNPGAMNEMFNNMESGAPVPLGSDTCGESIQASVDICGFGMKDMNDAFGFGLFVYDFSNSSVCNKEELSSFVMGMAEGYSGGGAAGGSTGGGGGTMFGEKRTGSGTDNVKLMVYLDSDGSTASGCTIESNNSLQGFEFKFKYSSVWNSSTSKAVETFNSYKCENDLWKIADIKISAWKKKMCSEIGGPMIAVDKSGLAKFPTLYDSIKDMRVYVITMGNTGNTTNPTDSAGPGWTTPGSIDFEIFDAFSYGADTAKFEDILKKGFVQGEDCFDSTDNDGDTAIDCSDYDCQYASSCSGLGVNAANYTDTKTPQVMGVRVEEYPDSALIMYDTNKPANGTVEFYAYGDSQCLNKTNDIFDIGLLSTNVRDYKSWHTALVYSGNDSLGWPLAAGSTYYYKIKVCDSSGKCAISRCTALKTASTTTSCGFCNFVTRIKAPSDWKVKYDINRDGVYEHIQGEVCGPNAGLKTNYTTGRRVNIRLEKSDGSTYIEFINASLTKTGLNDKVRTIETSGDIISTSALIGLTSETRDKIINNLHPEVCRIKVPVPSGGVCDKLYHCDGSGANCIDRTAAAGGAPINVTNCIWNVPYCEFSTYKTTASSGGSSSSSSGGGGGGGSITTAKNKTNATSQQPVDSGAGDGTPETGETQRNPIFTKEKIEKGLKIASWVAVVAVIISIVVGFILKRGIAMKIKQRKLIKSVKVRHGKTIPVS